MGAILSEDEIVGAKPRTLNESSITGEDNLTRSLREDNSAWGKTKAVLRSTAELITDAQIRPPGLAGVPGLVADILGETKASAILNPRLRDAPGAAANIIDMLPGTIPGVARLAAFPAGAMAAFRENKGKPATERWKEAGVAGKEFGQQVSEQFPEWLTSPYKVLAELAGGETAQMYKDNPVANLLEGINKGVEHGSTGLEKGTGIPSEFSAAGVDAAMTLGGLGMVKGARPLKSLQETLKKFNEAKTPAARMRAEDAVRDAETAVEASKERTAPFRQSMPEILDEAAITGRTKARRKDVKEAFKDSAKVEELAARAETPPGPAMWGEHAVEVTGESMRGPDGQMHTPIRQGKNEGWAPTRELSPVNTRVVDVPLEPEATFPPGEGVAKGKIAEPVLIGDVPDALRTGLFKLEKGNGWDMTHEERIALRGAARNAPPPEIITQGTRERSRVDSEAGTRKWEKAQNKGLDFYEKGQYDPKILFAIGGGTALGLYALKLYREWEAARREESDKQQELDDMNFRQKNYDKQRKFTDAGEGGLAAAALMGAVKGKGGSWHPEAVARLAESLKKPNPLRAWDSNVPELPENLQADRMIRGYLNKHAGTEADPLGKVEIPAGEGTASWESLMDKAITSRVATEGPVWKGDIDINQGARPGETLHDIRPSVAAEHIKSFLSHAADYARERIPPEKLGQYDLVRLVKETLTWDKELAKKMQDARKAEKETSPIYREYPDGMYWQQLTKPGQFARESDAMGHSVRGYEPKGRHEGARFADWVEPHPDWIPESGDSGHPSYGHGGWEAIRSGEAKVYSLRDAKGESHATVEVRGEHKVGSPMRGEDFLIVEPSISQIKGKQNRAPAERYIPYIQDFVKGEKWGEVGDLGNTGLVDSTFARSLKSSQRQRESFQYRFGEDKYIPRKAYEDWLESKEWTNFVESEKRPTRGIQQGSTDPRLLAALAVGGVAGYNLSSDHPLLGAALGAGAATAALSARRSAQAISKVFAADKRIRINDLADKWDGEIAAAGRYVWQQAQKVAELAPKKEGREQITQAMQSGKLGNLPGPLRAAGKQAQEAFAALGEQGKKEGVLKGLIDNYVTNLWDLTGKNKEAWERILDKAGGPTMSPESRFALKRSIESIEEGEKMGLTPVTKDVAEILSLYGNSLSRSIANKHLVDGLRSQVDPASGTKLLLPSPKAPHAYVTIDHPQLNGVRVHPDIAPSMKFLFDNSAPGAVSAALQGINTAIKRSAVSFSLFHAKALADAQIGAHGVLKGIPMTAKSLAQATLPGVFGENIFLKQLREGGAGDIVDQAQKGGLKFSMEKGKLADEDLNGSFYTALTGAQKLLDSVVLGAGLPVKAIANINHAVDTFMWERLHAGMKLGTFASKLEIIRENNAKAAAEGRAEKMSEHELAKQAASFTNDIYGGLNWRMLAEEAHTKWGRDIALSAYSPKGRQVQQLLLFAPDWTISTSRAAFRTAGQLLGYDKGTGWRGLLEAQNATDLHRQYLMRSAVYYALVGDAINYSLSGHHLWDNKDPTMLDMGDGRTMQWSKHSMEPVHWITKPGQQGLNKLGFFPKEAANQLLGTEYLSAAGRSPKMDTSAAGRVSHVGRSMMPIAAQQAFGSNASTGSGVAGFLGAPIYGKTNEERAAIKARKKEEAREKRRLKQMGVVP